jgi:tRNA-dihydrouridine synthase 3
VFICVQILENETMTDFVDLNCGCPIDVICSRGAGSALMNRPRKLCDIVDGLTRVLKHTSVTVKIRTGWDEKNPTGHKLIPDIQKVARGKISAVMVSVCCCRSHRDSHRTDGV